MAETRFTGQERYEEIFGTEKGWILVAAEIEGSRSILKLSNFLIEPLETRTLQIGTRQLLKIREELERYASQEGYTHLEILGVRLTGSSPNRPIYYGRRLA